MIPFMNNDRKNMLNPSNIFLFLNQLQRRNVLNCALFLLFAGLVRI